MFKKFIPNQLLYIVFSTAFLACASFFGNGFFMPQLSNFAEDKFGPFIIIILMIHVVFSVLLYFRMLQKFGEYNSRSHQNWNIGFTTLFFMGLFPTSMATAAIILVVGAYFLIDKFKS